MKSSSKYKSLIKVLILLTLVTACYLVYLNKQNIYDYIALFGYHPPAEIASLSQEDSMTSYTKRVFYVNHPELEDKANFALSCPDSSEQFVVLGCYRLNQNGIFLLNVNNSDLNGIIQVTAAYETLHAIYQRLSSSAQANLNAQLISFENNDLTDPTIKAQIANFKKTEPGEVLNEMTSLFGTEVPSLTPGLNSFYAKYFNNRQVLVSLYESYESAFTSRQNQITSYDTELSNLKNVINSDETQLTSQLAILNSQQNQLNSLKSSGNIPGYNALVPTYNQGVASYNDLVRTTSAEINQYNAVVGARNSIALEEQQLTNAITAQPKALPH